jgi:hypothetical protein
MLTMEACKPEDPRGMTQIEGGPVRLAGDATWIAAAGDIEDAISTDAAAVVRHATSNVGAVDGRYATSKDAPGSVRGAISTDAIAGTGRYAGSTDVMASIPGAISTARFAVVFGFDVLLRRGPGSVITRRARPW